MHTFLFRKRFPCIFASHAVDGTQQEQQRCVAELDCSTALTCRRKCFLSGVNFPVGVYAMVKERLNCGTP